MRIGIAGIGGRIYTNFGPLRVDVATPLNPRPGDGKVALQDCEKSALHAPILISRVPSSPSGP